MVDNLVVIVLDLDVFLFERTPTRLDQVLDGFLRDEKPRADQLHSA